MDLHDASSSSAHTQSSIDKIQFAYKDLKQRYTSIFESGSIPTLNELRSQGLSGQLASSDAPLRSIYWQLYFSHLPLQDPSSWPILLTRQRSDYSQNRRKRLRAPDGSYPPETGLTQDQDLGFNSANTATSLNRAGTVVKDLRVNNPLSLDEETPWKSHYASKDLRATISTDVERAFPDNPLFRLPEVQRSLSNLILVWCLMNPDIGYRQGIHELAAAIWYVRKRESVRISSISQNQKDEIDKRLETILDDRFIEHDAFAILNAVMQNAKSWYEWRERSQVSKGPGDISTPNPSPIVIKCERIHATLKVVDPALASHLESLSIEPQLYALRWIRLMFTREFQLEDALQIWDGIFSEDTSLSLVDFVCIAMLERIRSKILSSDYSGALQILLHYPTQSSSSGGRSGGEHPSLLVQQALRLREVTSPTTGVEIVYQNRDVLGIQLHPAVASNNPSKAPLPTSRRGMMAYTVATGRSHGQRAPLPRLNSSPSQNQLNPNTNSGAFASPPSTNREPLDATSAPSSTSTAAFSASSYLPEGLSDLARGIYERSDALGINKALVTSLSNVQKTVGAYAARNQGGSQNEGPFGPGAEESVRARRAALNQPSAGVINPSLSAQSTDQVSRNLELEALKETNKAMGSVVQACVEVFERQWVQSEKSNLESGKSEVPKNEEENMNSASIETLMSLCAMKHVRDVLLGVAREFDPAILGSPEKVTQDLPKVESPKEQVRTSPKISTKESVPQNKVTSNPQKLPAPSASSPVKASPPLPSQAQNLARHRAFARVDDSNSSSLPSTSPSVFTSYQSQQDSSSGPSRSSQTQTQSPQRASASSLPKPQAPSSTSNLRDPLNSTPSPNPNPQQQRFPPPQTHFFNQQQQPSSISSSSFASHAGTIARRDSTQQRASIVNSNSSNFNSNSNSVFSSYPPTANSSTPRSSGTSVDVEREGQKRTNPRFEGLEFRSEAGGGAGVRKVVETKGMDPLGAS